MDGAFRFQACDVHLLKKSQLFATCLKLFISKTNGGHARLHYMDIMEGLDFIIF